MSDFKPVKSSIGDIIGETIMLLIVFLFIGGAAYEFLWPILQMTFGSGNPLGAIVGVLVVIVIVYFGRLLYVDYKKKNS